MDLSRSWTGEQDVMSDDIVLSILDQYHPLVRYIAKCAYHSSATLDIEDLYQVGDMAVLRAVKSYDPSLGSNIKSFVSDSVRNAVFKEAARFLGALTVDARTTNQASYVVKLHEKGKSDKEIADILTEKYNRKFDIDHVRDLRITYSRRQYVSIEDNITTENDVTINMIDDLLESVIKDNIDRIILAKRILGTSSVKQVAEYLKTTSKIIYEREADLKNRIKRAIEGAE